MASPQCCAAGQVVPNKYDAKGETKTFGDLEVYIARPSADKDKNKAIIFAYDIFGWNTINRNVFRVADIWAEAGYLVVMPDFYRGNPWDLNNFPPPSWDDLMVWWGQCATMEIVRADLDTHIYPFLKEQGIDTVGVAGTCWGGLVALTQASDSRVSGIASLHGAKINKELASAAQCPVAILPAKDDPGMELKEITDQKPFGDKCVYKAYPDQAHGFTVGRGDWTDKTVREAALDALKTVSTFFDNVM